MNTLATTLTKISGVGEKKAKLLFTYFKTIDRIKNASIDELMRVPGVNQALAVNIQKYFKENN